MSAASSAMMGSAHCGRPRGGREGWVVAQRWLHAAFIEVPLVCCAGRTKTLLGEKKPPAGWRTCRPSSASCVFQCRLPSASIFRK